MKLYLDFETRSAVDIKKVGAWAYALHPSTDVTCIGYGSSPADVTVLGGLERRFDWRGAQIPDIASRTISAHNAHFEYAVYNLILHRRYGWPARWDPALWSCTMARAATCGLPLDLDSLGRVLDIKTPKDLKGRRLMLSLAKPAAVDPLDGPVWREAPADYARLYAYNRVDVLAEMEVDALLPEMAPEEKRVWDLDLLVNRRGVRIDVTLAKHAAALSEKLVAGLNARLLTLTNGFVDKATRVAALKQFLAERHNITVDSLDKESVTTLLESPQLPAEVREVLTVRRQVGKKNSVAKYTAAVEMAAPSDSRARGLLQYHAAHTGRWGGRGLQPQNFPKGFGAEEQAPAINAIMAGDVAAKYGDKAMDALSDSLRGVITATPGKELICADFNAIEARVLFWLADDQSALGSYRRGESPYVEMAQRIYGDSAITKKTHPQQYDIGKRTILGCGYGMGAVKFRLNVYAETAKTGKPVTISEELAERAVAAYRDKYSSVRRMWYAIEAAAINAVKTPGKVYWCCGNRVAWGMTADRRFLACRLPSGRFLRYWKPSVRLGKTPWGEEKEELCYWGVDSDTKQWALLKTYGGALTENVVQAIARDLLAEGMLRVQAAGYDVVLTVHDEVLSEILTQIDSAVRSPREMLDDYIAKLCELPPWAKGCPVAAEGWVGQRYRK